MYENIDLSKIPVFLAVADCLSFTEAAYQLYSTQSSVSKAIAGLEASLGYPLFVRENRKIFLTDEGEFLHSKLKEKIDEINAILIDAKKIHQGDTGCISIAISGYHPKNATFEEICSSFAVKYPSYELDLKYVPYSGLRNCLINRKTDAIFSIDRDLSMLTGYSMFPVMTGGPMLVCNQFEQLDKSVDELSLTDFSDRKFISLDPDLVPGFYEDLIMTCDAYGFKPNIVKYVKTIHEIVMYIGSSYLVSVFDRAIFPMLNSDLKTIPIPVIGHMHPPLQTVIAWSEINTNPALQQFVEFATGLLKTEIIKA